MDKDNTAKKNTPRPLDERKLAILKAQEIRDKTFKLMVKIISWETDSLDSVVVKSLNKITKQEWAIYKKNILNIPTSASIEKVKERLTKTFDNIKRNGGFE